MSVFDLPLPAVAELVASVRGPQPGIDETADAFARVAWTVLIEPGDQVAGQLIGALGSRRALELVIAGDAAAAAEAWTQDGTEPRSAMQIAVEAFERWRLRLAVRPVVRAIEQAARLGLRVAVPADPGWPAGLSALGPAEPVALWVRGGLDRLAAFAGSVAVVGARAATGYGEHVAVELAGGLVDRGVAIVSGGAYGIDAAAHRSALASDGLTMAFLAGGLDRTYPAGNADLLARVAQHGMLLAEVPPGVPPTRVRFLSRNRLLAASTAATVVVEAGARSGSLNTAHHALSIGRPLGAVPGPVTSAMSAGCHRLLREEDVVCVTCADDVVELVGGTGPAAPPAYRSVDPQVTRVLDELGTRRGRSTDEIARSSGMSVGATLGVLGALEAEGAIRRIESGWVRSSARIGGAGEGRH
ncbi:MAG: DNA protecting protein DprA [Micrococcales bacterium 73-13]|nr:MAG: DNA protecting protein DprA [Micrococcales bacterium 73-13]